jgi:hypothetical protein
LIAIAPSGEVRWRFTAPGGGGFAYPPVLWKDDVILIAPTDSGGKLFAIGDRSSETLNIEYSSVVTWDTTNITSKSSYQWRGTNSSNFPAWNNAKLNSPDWVRMHETVWTERGIEIESRDEEGIPHCALYSRQLQVSVARFTGASLRSSEAFYHGFERYEQDAFDLSGNARIVWYDSFTGSQCLEVPASGRAMLRTSQRAPTPLERPPGKVALSAYVKMAGDAPAGGTISLTLTDAFGRTTKLAPAVLIGGTGDQWRHVSTIGRCGRLGRHWSVAWSCDREFDPAYLLGRPRLVRASRRRYGGRCLRQQIHDSDRRYRYARQCRTDSLQRSARANRQDRHGGLGH